MVLAVTLTQKLALAERGYAVQAIGTASAGIVAYLLYYALFNWENVRRSQANAAEIARNAHERLVTHACNRIAYNVVRSLGQRGHSRLHGGFHTSRNVVRVTLLRGTCPPPRRSRIRKASSAG